MRYLLIHSRFYIPRDFSPVPDWLSGLWLLQSVDTVRGIRLLTGAGPYVPPYLKDTISVKQCTESVQSSGTLIFSYFCPSSASNFRVVCVWKYRKDIQLIWNFESQILCVFQFRHKGVLWRKNFLGDREREICISFLRSTSFWRVRTDRVSLGSTWLVLTPGFTPSTTTTKLRQKPPSSPLLPLLAQQTLLSWIHDNCY